MKKDCIFITNGECRALDKLYCKEEKKECRFYKSNTKYDAVGNKIKK